MRPSPLTVIFEDVVLLTNGLSLGSTKQSREPSAAGAAANSHQKPVVSAGSPVTGHWGVGGNPLARPLAGALILARATLARAFSALAACRDRQ